MNYSRCCRLNGWCGTFVLIDGDVDWDRGVYYANVDAVCDVGDEADVAAVSGQTLDYVSAAVAAALVPV